MLLKTHKLTVLLTVPNTHTVNDVKQEALDALQSDVLAAPNPHPDAMDEDDSEWTVPKVSSMDDFELAKASKDKGRPTGNYETLVGTDVLADLDMEFMTAPRDRPGLLGSNLGVDNGQLRLLHL